MLAGKNRFSVTVNHPFQFFSVLIVVRGNPGIELLIKDIITATDIVTVHREQSSAVRIEEAPYLV